MSVASGEPNVNMYPDCGTISDDADHTVSDCISELGVLVATLRTRAEQAEAERDGLRLDLTNCADVGRRLEVEMRCAVRCAVHRAEMAESFAAAAEAEVARLRGEYARGLREAADVARAHGGISAYYAITKLAAEVELAAEVSDV